MPENSILTVGITGQPGFIGTHLFNFLNTKKESIKLIPFKDEYFQDAEALKSFVSQCDTVVHLAAMNRHGDPQVIYNTNIQLVKTLINALDAVKSKAHILFSSSTQEERDNPYGKSKLEGRQMLIDWAKRTGGKFTGFIIPNVFGPFGNPYYNSVIATFCHQLTHNEQPKIDVDGELKLIYVGELVEHFYKKIMDREDNYAFYVPYTSESKVSALLQTLEKFKTEYFEKGMIPQLNSRFEINLFNTFRCFMDVKNHFPVKFIKNTDERGTFVETIKAGIGGQMSFSTTKPGITRGNHYHTRKIERFAVIKGEALIELRRIGTNEVLKYKLSGDDPAYVDMPVWYSHNITNAGTEELYTIFWINEFFDPADPDTFFEKV